MDLVGDGPRLRPLAAEVPLSQVRTGLAEALAGGAPIAPLPADPAERRQAEAMLGLDRPERAGTAAVVATSGSTGTPKGVLLSGDAIRAAATASAAALGGAGSWLLALPVHYVAGLMVVARAVVAGTEVAEVGSDLAALPPVLERLPPPHYLSVVHIQLSRALRQPALVEALARLDAVLLGGGPAPDGLREAAAARGVRLVVTYGMSETCGGCVYDGRPLPGVEVGCGGTDGRIRIRGPVLFSGYRLRPDLTRTVLQDGQFLTADRGRWRDGRLEVLGRVDDLVISGGRNVDLHEMELLARRWPLLGDADLAVVGLHDPEWGTAVVAVAEPSAGDLDGLRRHLAPLLPRWALPRRLERVSRLPRTSSGKVDRQRLANDLQREPAPVGGVR